MMNGELIGLFPTAVFKKNIDRQITEQEYEFPLLCEKISNTGNSISANKQILNCDELTEIKEFCLNTTQYFFDQLFKPRKEDNVEIYITQSWFNYAKKNQYHPLHIHPNSIISGVFYFNVDDNDGIEFSKSMSDMFCIVPSEIHAFNMQSTKISVEKGDLILFPSNLIHSVAKINSDYQRISLAFNTFVRGNIGHNDNVTELILK